MTSSEAIPCRIDRRADYQGSRPSVLRQAEVGKYVTGCDGLSPSTNSNGTRKSTEKKTSKKMSSIANIRIATINVRTCREDIKLAQVVKAASQLNIDVLAIQEARRIHHGHVTLEDDSLFGWQLVWSGHKRKHRHGVPILLAPHVTFEEYFVFLDARIIAAKVKVHGMCLSILNGYAPCDSSKSEAAKLGFYSALSKAKKKLDETPKFKTIVLGDFNATISSQSKTSGAWDAVLGYNNSDRIETTGNGEKLLAWCLKSKMKIVNSIYRTKRIHRGTWYNSIIGRWKRIDYICTTGWVLKFVRSCRAYTTPSKLFDTDHRLLVMNIDFPTSKKSVKLSLLKGRRKEVKPRRNYNVLRDDPSKRDELTQKIDNYLEFVSQEDTNVDLLNEGIAEAVRSSADEVCPVENTIMKKEPWEDEVLQGLISRLNECKKKEEVKKIQKKIRDCRKRLKNEYFETLADGINTVAEARQIDKEFALAKKYSALKTGTRNVISKEKLKTHFESHFAARPIEQPLELTSPEQFPHLSDAQFNINQDAPARGEIKQALSSFKNNRHAGTDKVKTEGLKYNSSEQLLTYLLLLMSLIWSTLKVPCTWLHAEITSIFKKGSQSVASNYRGISIGTNMSRILCKVIISRLKEAYESSISNAQFGFRKNRSTTDGIFIMKNVIEKYKGSFIAVYIDLTAAYDHIPREFLFKVLEIRTGASFLIHILKLMYLQTTASIKGMKTTFEVLVGCRQGGQESPVIFNYYFDFVLKIAATEIDNAFPEGWGLDFPFNIPNVCSNRAQRARQRLRGVEIIRWILYADDIVLFAKSAQEAERLLNIINTTCKRFGLNISFKKTKTQVFNNESLATEPTLFNIDGHSIENVSQFTYLGYVFDNGSIVSSTEHCIARASAKFNQLRTVLCDTKVNKQTRWKFLETCVAPRLLYGLQACYPKEEQLKKIESCWSQFLRSMVKGGWRRRSEDPENPDYRFVYKNSDIQRILKC